MQSPEYARIIEAMKTNPLYVHEFLFPHRHPQAAAPFHYQLCSDWYADDPDIVQVVFRGGAKTTLGEEALTVLGVTETVHNACIIGSSEKRAKERLEAIKHELNTNEKLRYIFGDLGEGTAHIWQADKIVLANNVCIQALGWNQSMRGVKHLEWRPDLGWIDDIEGEDDAREETNRQKIIRRLLGTVVPAIDSPGRKLRVTGTIIDTDSLVVRLAKLPNWTSRNYPVKYISKTTGAWEASWSARKPLPEINLLEAQYEELGEHIIFDREYMCRAIQEEDKSFQRSYIRSEPIVRTYQPTYLFYDPARTVNQSTSAHTGKVAASWVNNRILVWESSGNFWKPDEIVTDIFEADEKYQPIEIIIEETGLNEFLLQPIRSEAIRRGHTIPLRPVNAPKGKNSFIRGLQPYAKAGELIFVPDQESHLTCISQLLSFPSGRIDVPNALAYILKVHMGQLMLEGFSPSVHIDERLSLSRGHPTVLAVHSEHKFTTAVLFQLVRGQYRVLFDWVLEGDPGNTLRDIVLGANLVVGGPYRVVAPPSHFSHYDTVGLANAARSIPVKVERGHDPLRGLEVVRRALDTTPHASPGLACSPNASWVLRALAAGYSRPAGRDGLLSAGPRPGPYATLMEGLQSAVARAGAAAEADDGRHYAVTPSGAQYLTSRR